MAQLFGYVDMTDSGFIAAILSIAFNPFFWNVVRAACTPATPGDGTPLGCIEQPPTSSKHP